MSAFQSGSHYRTVKPTETGKKLRAARIERGENLRQMANNLGVESSTLSKLEFNDSLISNDISEKIKNQYGVSISK